MTQHVLVRSGQLDLHLGRAARPQLICEYVTTPNQSIIPGANPSLCVCVCVGGCSEQKLWGQRCFLLRGCTETYIFVMLIRVRLWTWCIPVFLVEGLKKKTQVACDEERHSSDSNVVTSASQAPGFRRGVRFTRSFPLLNIFLPPLLPQASLHLFSLLPSKNSPLKADGGKVKM